MALVHKGVPYADVMDMGPSQIFELLKRLDRAQWHDELNRTRLTHVAAQGSSKQLNKALKPIQRELDKADRTNGDGSIEAMMPELRD